MHTRLALRHLFSKGLALWIHGGHAHVCPQTRACPCLSPEEWNSSGPRGSRTCLVGVTVTHDYDRPDYMCCRCMQRPVSLERAAVDLLAFRRESLARYESLTPQVGPLKRTKECSGSIVSPDTARDRPVPKRSVTWGRRLDLQQYNTAR